VLTLAVVVGVLLWQRDGAALRRLCFPAGWTLAVVLTFAWPLWMVTRHGSGALSLWIMHVADRLRSQAGSGPFAGEPWWEYVPALLTQGLPWTPLALAGAWRSLSRAVLQSSGSTSGGRVGILIPAPVVAGDRLLWVWAAAPLALLALATVKNAHYAISAQGPWSIWAALGLARLGEWLRLRQTWDRKALLLATQGGFAVLALAYGLAFWLLAPWFDRRGVEWAFYESAGRRFPLDISLVLLYDDWDRNPYKSPFGPIPHDLAVRLFYLNRPACWYVATESPVAQKHAAGRCSSSTPRSTGEAFAAGPPGSAFAVLSRAHNLPMLEQIGHVKVIAHGPRLRRDRTYDLFLVMPGSATFDSPVPIANSGHLSVHR